MSVRTGTKFAKFGLAAAAMAAVALPASMLLSGPAIGNDTPASPHAAVPGADGTDVVDTTRITAGRELFNNWSCSACHALSDAKASGAVGPSLDGDANLTEDFIRSRVTDGQGAMPAFGGQMTEEEIADVAYYISHVAKK